MQTRIVYALQSNCKLIIMNIAFSEKITEAEMLRRFTAVIQLESRQFAIPSLDYLAKWNLQFFFLR